MINEDILARIIDIVSKIGLNVRLKATFDNEPSSWEPKVVAPSSGYLELLKYGPVALKDLEWVEIDSVKFKKVGRLLSEKKIDCKKDLLALLNKECIFFEENNHLIKINNTF